MAIIKTKFLARRDTTENWLKNKDVIPDEGEPCLDLNTGVVKWGDGVTTYENLKASGTQANHYEGIRGDGEDDNAVIVRVLTTLDIEPERDDIFIVKALISGDRYSYTSYVYNGSAWAAMDGNYNAKNVYFDSDLTVTYTMGKYAVNASTPNKTIPINGKNLHEAFIDIYSDETNPTKTDPKVTNFNVTGNGASATSFEVGTTVTPQWTSTFNAGTYTYKSSASNTNINPVSGTGVTATSWEVKQGSNAIGTAEDGKATTSFVIGEGVTDKVSGTVSYSIVANYSNGNYALTNLDNLPKSEVRITAGATATVTDTLTYVRKMFGGGTSAETVDSAVVRDMKSANASAIGSSAPFEFIAVAGDDKVVFCYPKAMTTKTPTFEIFTMAWGETSGFVSSEISVADARGTNEDGSLNNAMVYTVWTYAPVGGFAASETKYRAYFK